MADEKITVIDDKDREEEALSLCKWAAARAGVMWFRGSVHFPRSPMIFI